MPKGYSNRDFKPWTEEEIIKAIKIKDSTDMTWKMIANEIGRSEESLPVMVSAYKRGKLDFKRQKSKALLEKMSQEVISGKSISSTARKYNKLPHSFYKSLLRMGYDKETIAEARMDELP